MYPRKCGPFSSLLPENFKALQVKDSVDSVMGRVVYLIKIGYVFMSLLFKSLGIQILSNWIGPVSDNYKSVKRSEQHHDLLYNL